MELSSKNKKIIAVSCVIAICLVIGLVQLAGVRSNVPPNTEVTAQLEEQEQAYDKDDFLALCAMGTLEEMEFALKNGEQVNSRDDMLNTTPLLAAITDLNRNRAAKKVIFLINNGADVNAKDDEGLSPLSLAVSKEHSTDIIEKLIAAGADIEAADIQGLSPLMLAAASADSVPPKDQAEYIKILINAGADLTKAGPGGVTPLTLAAINAPPEILKLLIENGFDVNRVAAEGGYTPLMIATWSNSFKAVEMLVAKGADPAAKDDSGLDALAHADLYGNPDADKIKAILKRIQNL